MGGGSWGTVFSALLRDRGHEVVARLPRRRAGGDDPRRPGATRATRATPTCAGIEPRRRRGAARRRGAVVVAVPSRAFAEVVGGASRRGAGALAHQGPRPGRRATGSRRSFAAARSRSSPARTSPRRSSRGLPAAAVIASEDAALAQRLQEEINSAVFRVYVNDDVVGVELCAAAKNVIALAAGGADGLGAGRQREGGARRARASRDGSARRRRPAAVPETFAGLAGMGDLIVTCWSPVGPQPARRRADRAGHAGRTRRWRRSAWSSRA